MVLSSPCPLSRRVGKYFGKVGTIWGARYLYVIVRGPVASRGVLQSLALSKTIVLKCSRDQAPFHIFGESTGEELWKSLVGKWQAVEWGWRKGVPDPWGVLTKSAPVVLEFFSLLQLEFISPFNPWAGAAIVVRRRSANSNPYKRANLPLSSRSLTMPQAWCPGVKQRKQERTMNWEEGSRRCLWLSKSVFGLTAPNLHHPAGEVIISRWTSGSSIGHLWPMSQWEETFVLQPTQSKLDLKEELLEMQRPYTICLVVLVCLHWAEFPASLSIAFMYT